MSEQGAGCSIQSYVASPDGGKGLDGDID